jgi:hypothetical protein
MRILIDYASDRANGIFDVSYVLHPLKFCLNDLISAFFAIGDVVFFMSALSFFYVASSNTKSVL